MLLAAIGHTCYLYHLRRGYVWIPRPLNICVRQPYLKTGDAATGKGRAAKANGPAVFLDNAFADPQTQPGALG